MQVTQRWNREQAISLFNKPFFDLLFQAQQVHRKYFRLGQVQISTLLSIKTGNCAEDCKYCPQSSHYETKLDNQPLVQLPQVLAAAKKASDAGSTRFCIGAAWKKIHDRDMQLLEQIVTGVKAIGLETCMTLGILKPQQAQRLAKAGLDFYNHNLDTSPEFYHSIVTTRSYQDRLNTIENVRKAGIKICSGGIIGLGETISDRAGLLVELANLPEPPSSVPINMLVKVRGTPMFDNKDVDPFDLIRMIAVTRIMMPTSYVRLSAGREQMNEQTQAICFMAGANSIFYGRKLLTSSNPTEDSDKRLFRKLGMQIEKHTTIKNSNWKKKKLLLHDNQQHDNTISS
uniref:biotin synthase n=1 Tax=Homalodisca liturata TaxID=320908 RepID=A0A1B6HDL5_9HEMI